MHSAGSSGTHGRQAGGGDWRRGEAARARAGRLLGEGSSASSSSSPESAQSTGDLRSVVAAESGLARRGVRANGSSHGSPGQLRGMNAGPPGSSSESRLSAERCSRSARRLARLLRAIGRA